MVLRYLVGSVSRWNHGKQAELKDRVTHTDAESFDLDNLDN